MKFVSNKLDEVQPGDNPCMHASLLQLWPMSTARLAAGWCADMPVLRDCCYSPGAYVCEPVSQQLSQTILFCHKCCMLAIRFQALVA